MKILGIEASSLVASVAVLDGDVITAEYTVNYKKTHSQTLMPMLKEIAAITELDLNSLDAIAVSGGPGSFTGLRIGSATAKGLGLALDKPLIHVPTLDATAAQLPYCAHLICVMMDARRDQVYTGLYYNRESLQIVHENDALAIADLLDLVKARGEKTVFLGDGVPVHRAAIEAALGQNALFAPAGTNRQRAAAVALLGAQYYERGETQTAGEHVPVYLRMSQAEREYVEIREADAAAPEQLSQLAAIEAACFSDAWSREDLRALLTGAGRYAYLAMRRGVPAAYILLQDVAGDGEILRIGTLPDYRKKGIAGRLLAEAEKRHGAVTCWNLEVRESNLPAVSLYKKDGFSQIRVRPDYYADPKEAAVCMQKIVPQEENHV